MKKISLFACALAVSTMAVAQEKIQVQNLNKNVEFEADMTKYVEMNQEPTAPAYAEGEAMPLAKVANGETYLVESQYYYTDGQMHAGFSPTGGLYYPQILVPYLDSTTWYAYWKNDVAPTWYHGNGGGSIWKANSYTYTAYYDILGQYWLPILGGGVFTYNADTTYVRRPYLYGEQYAERTYLSVGAEENWYPMTLCEMWADTVGGKSQDFYAVGAGSIGKYANGTGMVFPATSAYAGRVDTMMQIVENPADVVFKINEIQFSIYGQSTDSIGSMIPAGAKVKVEIVPVVLTSTGRTIYLKSPIATTTFSAEDWTQSKNYKYTGMVTATFKEKNDWGVEEVVPVYVKGAYAVVLTNYNESGCNFGIRSDYYCPKTNSTLFKKNGKLSTIWSDGGNNLAINYVGYWPAVYEDYNTKEMIAPINGGLAAGDSASVLYFKTNVDYESYIEDAEEISAEWMTVQYDTTYYSSYGYVVAGIICAPLPAAVEGREGTVTFNFDGNLYQVHVTQGNPTALGAIKAENVDIKKEIREGQVLIIKNEEIYDVLGNKVQK